MVASDGLRHIHHGLTISSEFFALLKGDPGRLSGEAAVEGHYEALPLTELRSRAGLWRIPRLDAPAIKRVAVDRHSLSGPVMAEPEADTDAADT